MPEMQSFKNHARFDTTYHFIIAPLVLANLVLSAYITIRDWPIHSRSHLWWIVMSIALVLIVAKLRSYSLALQDRVIRLEERLRYALLLPASDLGKANHLALDQIIALRFAPDAELHALIERTLAEKLTPKQIKAAIVVWRPDYHRI
jgi:hypothetical protein